MAETQQGDDDANHDPHAEPGNHVSDERDGHEKHEEHDEHDAKSSPNLVENAEEEEEDELPPSELEVLKEENRRLRKKLTTLLNGSLTNRGVFCTIVYNRLSKDSQKQIEEIIQKEFDEIEKEREEDTKEEQEEEELEDTKIVPPRALVQYYPDFFIDKMGDVQYLQKTNVVSSAPAYTAYEGTLGVVIKEPEPEPPESSTPKTPKKTKGACWNCGSTEHQLINCPEPRNRTAIEENRQEFLNNSHSSLTPSNLDSRYYEEESSIDKDLISTFKPGVLSQNLKDALGMKQDEEPPYYRSMRVHGYPPSYVASELEMEDPLAKKKHEPATKVLFPGLNVPPQRSPTTPPRREQPSPITSNNNNNNTNNNSNNNTNNNNSSNTTPTIYSNSTPPYTNTLTNYTKTITTSNSQHPARMPTSPIISPVQVQPFSPFQSPPYMNYAPNAAQQNTQQYRQIPPSPYKPPASTSLQQTGSDLTETDMDMT